MRSSARVVRWVVPAYNEAASIGDLVARIAEVSGGAGWDFLITVVDDGSSDGTGELALSEAAAAEGRVEVLRNEPNQGLGRTIRRGLRAAAEASGPDDVILTLDADLTQDPEYAPSMLERIEAGADVVIASRYRRGSGVEGLSLLRRVLSYGASGAVSLLRPIRGVRDYSCGFRAYRARTIAEAFARWGDDFILEPGFGCMVEIAERLRDHAEFAEVPFVLRYDLKRQASSISLLKTMGAYGRVLVRVAKAGRPPVPASTLALALSSVVLGSFGQLMLRSGAVRSAAGGLAGTLSVALVDPRVLGGLALYVVSAAIWLIVLSRLDLSVAYPIGASGYVVVVLLATLAGEVVPPVRWMGVALIVVGILFVGWLGAAPDPHPHAGEVRS